MSYPRSQSWFSRHARTITTLVFTGLFSIFISYTFASPPSSKYAPGETRVPTCAPTDTNCDVGVLPEQAGNVNKLLTTDGSTTSWTNTLTGTAISGSTNTLTNIPNSALTNASITINGSPVSLGGSVSNLALTTGNLSQFASTTSAQLAGVLSNETGTGLIVFNDAPTFATAPTVTAFAGSGNRCIYVDASGVVRVKGFDCGSATGGDNLGDHTATQNILLNGNWLSNDGGNEGIQISNAGAVTFSGLSTGIAHLSAGGALSSSLIVDADITTGTIANNKLANSSVTIGSTTISLGATSTTLAGLTSVTSTAFVGALTGNASTASALQTARSIQGVSFNGTADINPINGTGFVKATGTTLSYDNSTYLTAEADTLGTVATRGANAVVTLNLKAGGALLTNTDATTTDAYYRLTNTGGTYYMGVDNSTGSSFGQGAYTYNIYMPASRAFVVSQGATPGITLNSSGNAIFGGSVTGGAASFTTGSFTGATTISPSYIASSTNDFLTVSRTGAAVAYAIGYDSPNTEMYAGTSTSQGLQIRTNNTTRIHIPASGGTIDISNPISTGANAITGGAASFTTGAFSGAVTLGTTGVTNGIINTNDGMYINIDADASGSTPEFMIAKGRSGTSGGTALLTVSNAGAITGGAASFTTGGFSGKLSVSHSTASDYAASIYNTSATGEGLTIRGGATTSHNALVVQNYNGGSTWLTVRSGDGLSTFTGNITVSKATAYFIANRTDNTSETGIQFATGGTPKWYNYMAPTSDNTDLLRWYYAGDKMVLTPAGNLGLGTTSPTTGKLEITAGAAAASIAANMGDGIYSLLMTNTASSNKQWGIITRGNNIAIREGGVADTMTFQAGGNVGIGTTSPANGKLVVVGTTLSDSFGINNVGGSFMGSGGTDSYLGIHDGTNADLVVVTGGTKKGNVGIGTTSPTEELQVNGTGNMFRMVNTDGTTANTYAQMEFTAGSASNYIWTNNQNSTGFFGGSNALNIYAGPSGPVAFFSNGSSTAQMTIAVSGAVSIANLTSCGGIQTNGSGTMSCTSDETLKDKHGAFTAGLDAIRQINPESFSWKEDSGLYDGGVVYYGFIAQNVQAALPEAISISAGGKLQVSQLTLMAAAINAIKEMDINVADISNLTRENTWRDSLVAWFGNATNSITRIFTGEVCLSEPGQEAECINRAQLHELKQLLATPPQTSGPTTGGSGALDPGSDDSPQATCSDGIQNQDETGIDEGGVCTPPEEEQPPAEEPPIPEPNPETP